MQFRHELKYEINAIDAVAVRARLKAVCKPDANSKDGKYLVRSLYFDSPSDKALREKLDGASEKWELKTVWGVGYKFDVKD